MKLYETLEQQLKKEPNFVTDNGELKKWVVLNKAQNFDEELIGLLLDNSDLKDKFFVKVKGTLVFNQNLFVQFLEQKNYLNDSYTQYKNKVGLTIDGKCDLPCVQPSGSGSGHRRNRFESGYRPRTGQGRFDCR